MKVDSKQQNRMSPVFKQETVLPWRLSDGIYPSATDSILFGQGSHKKTSWITTLGLLTSLSLGIFSISATANAQTTPAKPQQTQQEETASYSDRIKAAKALLKKENTPENRIVVTTLMGELMDDDTLSLDKGMALTGQCMEALTTNCGYTSIFETNRISSLIKQASLKYRNGPIEKYRDFMATKAYPLMGEVLTQYYEKERGLISSLFSSLKNNALNMGEYMSSYQDEETLEAAAKFHARYIFDSGVHDSVYHYIINYNGRPHIPLKIRALYHVKDKYAENLKTELDSATRLRDVSRFVALQHYINTHLSVSSAGMPETRIDELHQWNAANLTTPLVERLTPMMDTAYGLKYQLQRIQALNKYNIHNPLATQLIDAKKDMLQEDFAQQLTAYKTAPKNSRERQVAIGNLLELEWVIQTCLYPKQDVSDSEQLTALRTWHQDTMVTPFMEHLETNDLTWKDWVSWHNRLGREIGKSNQPNGLHVRMLKAQGNSLTTMLREQIQALSAMPVPEEEEGLKGYFNKLDNGLDKVYGLYDTVAHTIEAMPRVPNSVLETDVKADTPEKPTTKETVNQWFLTSFESTFLDHFLDLAKVEYDSPEHDGFNNGLRNQIRSQQDGIEKANNEFLIRLFSHQPEKIPHYFNMISDKIHQPGISKEALSFYEKSLRWSFNIDKPQEAFVESLVTQIFNEPDRNLRERFWTPLYAEILQSELMPQRSDMKTAKQLQDMINNRQQTLEWLSEATKEKPGHVSPALAKLHDLQLVAKTGLYYGAFIPEEQMKHVHEWSKRIPEGRKEAIQNFMKTLDETALSQLEKELKSGDSKVIDLLVRQTQLSQDELKFILAVKDYTDTRHRIVQSCRQLAMLAARQMHTLAQSSRIHEKVLELDSGNDLSLSRHFGNYLEKTHKESSLSPAWERQKYLPRSRQGDPSHRELVEGWNTLASFTSDAGQTLSNDLRIIPATVKDYAYHMVTYLATAQTRSAYALEGEQFFREDLNALKPLFPGMSRLVQLPDQKQRQNINALYYSIQDFDTRLDRAQEKYGLPDDRLDRYRQLRQKELDKKEFTPEETDELQVLKAEMDAYLERTKPLRNRQQEVVDEFEAEKKKVYGKLNSTEGYFPQLYRNVLNHMYHQRYSYTPHWSPVDTELESLALEYTTNQQRLFALYMIQEMWGESKDNRPMPLLEGKRNRDMQETSLYILEESGMEAPDWMKGERRTIPIYTEVQNRRGEYHTVEEEIIDFSLKLGDVESDEFMAKLRLYIEKFEDLQASIVRDIEAIQPKK